MLTRLVLRDFQCHEKLSLELDPAVTVLVGRSDAGKSAVLRALRWLCRNRPDGDGFIRHGASRAAVTLVADGKRVRRARGKGVNEYRLDDARYVSFGKGGVPDPVAALLDVGEVNFSRQHDPVWFFSRTPGEVARELNGVVNLGLIDTALAAAASQVRAAQAREDECRRRLKDAKDRLDGLAWVDGADRGLRALEALQMSAKEKARKALLGASLLQAVAKASREEESAAAAFIGAKRAVRAVERAAEARGKADQAKNLVDKLSKVSRLANAPLPDTAPLDEAEALLESARAKREKAGRGRVLLDRLAGLRREEQEAGRGHEEAVEKLAAMMKRACPLCGRLI